MPAGKPGLGLHQGIREHFRQVQRSHGGQVLDLLPATGAGGHHDVAVGLMPDLFHEWPGNFTDNSYLLASAPKAPAMPQQPVSSKVTVRSGRCSARRRR